MLSSAMKKFFPGSLKSGKKDRNIPPERLSLIEKIGEGRYDIVWKGEWKKDDKTETVAVKYLKSDDDRQWLNEEADTMQKLSHENIVKFYGMCEPPVGVVNSQLKLVTEFAPYGSLESNLRNKEKRVCLISTLCKFAHQVALGMLYLSSQNLVHRDLKTKNILLFDQDLVKISDFRLAQSFQDGGTREVSLFTRLALPWMPPEVLQDRVFTSASDVWSYGVTLWEVFSFGQKPWAQLTLHEIKENTNYGETKRLAKPRYCPDGHYEVVLLKCWSSKPENRPTFKNIVEDIIPHLQPTETTTKVCHHETEGKGHLSFGKGEKVTIISRIDKVNPSMLLAQSTDSCQIGLIDEKHVDINTRKKGGSPRLSAAAISEPFGFKNLIPVKNASSKENEEGLRIDEGENFINLDTGYSDPYSTLSPLECNRQAEKDLLDGKPVPSPRPRKPRDDTSKTPAENTKLPEREKPPKRRPVPVPRRKTMEKSRDGAEPTKPGNINNSISKDSGFVGENSIDQHPEKHLHHEGNGGIKRRQIEEPDSRPHSFQLDVVAVTGGEVSADPQGSIDHPTVKNSPVHSSNRAVQPAASNSSGQINEELCGSNFENCYRTIQDADRTQNYNACKQCPGDLKGTGPNANAQELFEIFGKTVTFDFCIRALQHCNGNMDRAANYLAELVAEKSNLKT